MASSRRRRAGVGEDDGAQSLAVEGAVGLHDVGAELRHDLRVGRLARLDHLAREQVGIDDHAAQRAKHV